MDNRDEVREFLTSRLARITPARASRRLSASRHRGPGPRRAEVARLAGVGYYPRLERGDLGGVADHVLLDIPRAPRLDETDRTHLFSLARPGSARRAGHGRRGPSAPACGPWPPGWPACRPA